jgi:DNA-binding CsgD family transcriptional regulator
MRRGAIEAIEAAYRAHGTLADWLREIAQNIPVRPTGRGFVALRYHITATGHVTIDEQVELGTPADLSEISRGIVSSMSPEYVRETWATLPYTSALRSGPASVRAITRAGIDHTLGHFGIRDIVIVNGIDPTGSGVYFGELQSEPVVLTRRERATWCRVAAHLAAGYRLRRSTDDNPAAVISASGRIEHAAGDAQAQTAQDSLRRAALAIDRARTKRARTNADEAVELWNALVAGQWTLIDNVDTDGRRYFIARKNDPDVARHHALTRRERQVVGYAALGHSNKLIAYEMGLSTSAVAVYLDIAMEKLGLPSRAALILAARALGAQ